MNLDIIGIYKRLPVFLQAIIAALLSLFLNVSVAIGIFFLLSKLTNTVDDKGTTPVSSAVLGINTKNEDTFTEISKNILSFTESFILKESK